MLDLVAALGLEAVPVAIDDRGILPAALEAALEADIAGLIVTPRAHNPTGAALDAERVRALRRVLRTRPELLVVEDDHAGAVSGADAQTLWERDRERWAVVRSTSKTHGPDLRLAAIVGDSETIARVAGRQRVGFLWVSHILQRVVVELESDAASRNRVERAAVRYSERRETLVAALAARDIAAHGRSGLTVWVPVPEEVSVVQSLLAAGFAVSAGERFRLRTGPAIRVTIAALAPAMVPALADAIAASLGSQGRSAGS